MAKNHPPKRFARNLRQLKLELGNKIVEEVLTGLYDLEVYHPNDPLTFDNYVDLNKDDGISIMQARKGINSVGGRAVFVGRDELPKLKRQIERYEREVAAAKNLRREEKRRERNQGR
jgi:hypothetical protein